MLIELIPFSIATIIACAEVALSILFFVLASSAETAAVWDSFSVSISVSSAEIAAVIVLTSWLIASFADCFCSFNEVPGTWSALITLTASFNASCTPCAFVASSIESLATCASTSTFAFWATLSELIKVALELISPLTLTTSWSIWSFASCTWSDSGTSLCTWVLLISSIPWAHTSTIPCALIASVILFSILAKFLLTLFSWIVFSELVKVWSLSISSLTSITTWLIRSLAFCFWTTIERTLDLWSDFMFAIPWSYASLIPWASEARSIRCFIPTASLSTLPFCDVFSELVKVILESISIFTSFLTWSSLSLALAFCAVKSLPNTYAASVLFLPSMIAWIISSGPVAKSIAVCTSITVLATSFFCLLFSSSVKFWSASICLFTESAELAIFCLALVFWLPRSLPGTYAALTLALPSLIAWTTASGVSATSIAKLASAVSLSTSCFSLTFSAVIKFWSLSIFPLTTTASLAIFCLAIDLWVSKSLPGSYTVSILALPLVTAWTTSSGVVETSIAILILATATSKFCFCLSFSLRVKFWSASISPRIILALSAISCFAQVFWLFKSLPGS